METEDYIKSVRNEISIDEYMYSLANIKPENYGFIPRGQKISTFRFQFLIVFFAKAFNFLWPILAIFYFFILFVLALLKKKITSKCTPITKDELKDKGIIIPSSEDAIEKIISATKSSKNYILSVRTQPKDSKFFEYIDVFSLISYKTLSKVFWKSIICTYALAYDKRYSKISQWRVQSYTAFKWFLLASALENIHSNLYIADHFDRWAILADLHVNSSKKKGHKSTLTIVQHGIVNITKRKLGLPFRLPYRLISVDRLYIFDKESLMTFKNEIIAEKCILKSYKLFTPNLKLTGISGNLKKVLFVGNPACEEFHSAVFKMLKVSCNATEFIFFYKPHPTQIVSKSIKSLDWIIYNEPECFPDVDYVVSYPSTLALEYSICGKVVIEHAITETVSEAPKVVAKILNK